jgi:hypothetical protein
MCLLRVFIIWFAELRSIKRLNGIFHARTEENFQARNWFYIRLLNLTEKEASWSKIHPGRLQTSEEDAERVRI